MFENELQAPEVFIQTLQEYHETEEGARGRLANQMSDVIIAKRVDLAAVRHALLDSGRAELLDELKRLVDLIEPYIEEGGLGE